MSKKTHKLNLSAAFKHYIAQNSVQTYDRVQGLTDNLLGQEFDSLIQKLGYVLSVEGSGYALVAYVVNGKPVVDYAKVFDYKRVAGVLEEIYLETGNIIEISKELTAPALIRFYLSEGKVLKEEGYFNVDGWTTDDVVIEYPGEIIPAKLMKNNPLGEPDIPAAMYELLSELDYYGDELGEEWETVKTQFVNNLLFGSTKDGETWERDMKNGKRVHDVSDDDGKLQGAIAPFISGSTTETLILQNIQFIEDKLLKYSMQYREVNGSGNNKHNLEIASQNQQAYEYLKNKVEWRQRQLNKFFSDIYNPLSDENVEITITIPELEEYKTTNMKAAVENIQAQSANQLAQAENFKASAQKALTQEPVVNEEE